MRITSENLDVTIQRNQQIAREVEQHIQYIETRIIKWKYLPVEQQALEILKEHHLIELPIPDEDWGGAIRTFANGRIVPIINTAQPRVYQYFIYWHEVFHVTEYEEMQQHTKDYAIFTEFDLNERKADYFASQMIFGQSDLYDYYHSLQYDDFHVNIAHCIKSFKAPYKAVLIQLYQSASQQRNESLKAIIKANFDTRLTTEQWSHLFQQYSLDDSLIKPSFVLNLSPIKSAIQTEIKQHPDVAMYRENLDYVKQWEATYTIIQRKLKEQSNG
ncbi:hypothetical protein ACE3MZ_23020 [Paenibacillus sp. WLX1005]|uniref:hypothetical protein n=1 Tax=Paenibacillus sp. WLX1005 TaxID=3243766 RepID=UPI0039840186